MFFALLASLTDYLDGYFARKQGLSSTLGRNLDPLVDKVLIGGRLFIFLLLLRCSHGKKSPARKSTGSLPWMVTL